MVWEPDAATQDMRRLTGHRANLVNDRSRIKNRINSLLAQRLIKPPVCVLLIKTGLAWL